MINRFNNTYAFLSNFYNCGIEYDGVIFPTVENAFQAAKYTGNNKQEVYQDIASIVPGEATSVTKELGYAPGSCNGGIIANQICRWHLETETACYRQS